MSIALNLSDSQSGRKQKQKFKATTSKATSQHGQPQLTLEFRKRKTVKGIVVRRRAPPKNVKEKPKEKSPSPEAPPRKNYVMAPQLSDDDDVPKTTDEPVVELSLNVTQGPSNPKVERLRKLTQNERRDAKRIERKLLASRTLSKEEIDAGIKRFSELPDRRRASKKERPAKRPSLAIPETKLLGQRFVKPVTEKIFTGSAMDSVGLHPHCVKNLADILNITQLTTVQQKTIPEALKGRDILVRSQTGSGKTLAYALPVIQKLQEIRPKLTRSCGIRAVVIVPTRELAVQTYEILVKLLKPFTWVVAGFLTGGEKRKSEKARLRKGINILVGTPGRLVDHLLHTATLKLDQTQFLVLDEGDRLLEMGYERDVKKIVDGINDHKMGKFTPVESEAKSGKNPFAGRPKEDEINDHKKFTPVEREAKSGKNPFLARPKEDVPSSEKKELVSDVKLQTLLLSATMTSAVQRMAGLALKDPLFIDTSDEEVPVAMSSGQDFIEATQSAVEDGKLSIPATVQLSYLVVPPKLRLVTLSAILASAAAKGDLKAVVFMSTVEMVDYHHSLLTECLTRKVLDDDDEKEESDSDDDEEVLLKGVRIFRLHGSMQQTERTGVFTAFRKCKQGVLLATDVAGRGIDIIEVNLVVQYSPPQNIPEFVHRVGRTARAGRSGRAILFMSPNETEFIRRLEDRRIRISQGDVEGYVKVLAEVDDSANTTQEAASNLQHKFELLVQNDKEMQEQASKAFVSWVRFYCVFPKELQSIFQVKSAHMGHFAKSFALREPPKSFARQHTIFKPTPPKNRLTYIERDPEKVKQDKPNNKRPNEVASKGRNKFAMHLKNSKALNISEFDSGLPALKKRKKH